MTLPVLILFFGFVAAAVAGIYVLLRRMDRMPPPKVGEVEACRLLAAYDPDAVLAASRELSGATLLRLEDGRLGVAQAMGHHPTLHLFDDEKIVRVTPVGMAIEVVLNDFTTPRLTLATESAAEAATFFDKP